MSANKLANEGIVTQLAVVHTMLPKVKELIDNQIAEIEALKEGIEKLKDAYCQRDSQVRQQQAETDVMANTIKNLTQKVRQQQAEIEALKAGKIRAYDNGYEDGRKPDTNPKLAKTLTDEEIRKIHCITDGNINMIAFARAILRKAQDK